MSLISLPYTFTAGTTIASAQVNADFAAIVNVVNGNLDSTNFSTVLVNSNFASNHGHVTISGGLILQWGNPTGVAFDNSAVTAVTFDIAFPNNVLNIQLTVNQNTQNVGHAGAVSAYANTPTATGFNLTALGGSSGQTGSIYYFAVGY